jgi:TRAP-type mannitol/chloroaromatic compound transport system substrate-binding protein
MQAKYDARNPQALKRLLQAGAQLRPFPNEVMDASYKAANELYAEISKENEWFKKMHDAVMAFRNDEYAWWQVAELGYDAFMIRARRGG